MFSTFQSVTHGKQIVSPPKRRGEAVCLVTLKNYLSKCMTLTK